MLIKVLGVSGWFSQGKTHLLFFWLPILPEKIFITLLKFHFINSIKKELGAPRSIPWEFLEDGLEIKI
jgi:hypothetical protein